MIEFRPCTSDADFEQWLEVRRAVLPKDRPPTLEELLSDTKPGDLHLLALLDGEVAGSGLCKRSDIGGAFVAPRVLREKRGRGVGSTILRRLAAHAVDRGYTRAGSHVAGDDDASQAFARKFGFEETRRDVQQVLAVEPRTPREVDRVHFVSIATRPELVEQAYPLAQQGYEDMPIEGVDIGIDAWLAQEATLPEGSFVAFADSEIVGYAGLCRWPGDATRAEHGLTVVRRDWRGRGVAAALKERQIAWASANGLTELVTWTQTGNENMQAVNAKLGYVVRAFDLSFHRDLPLDD